MNLHGICPMDAAGVIAAQLAGIFTAPLLSQWLMPCIEGKPNAYTRGARS